MISTLMKASANQHGDEERTPALPGERGHFVGLEGQTVERVRQVKGTNLHDRQQRLKQSMAGLGKSKSFGKGMGWHREDETGSSLREVLLVPEEPWAVCAQSDRGKAAPWCCWDSCA